MTLFSKINYKTSLIFFIFVVFIIVIFLGGYKAVNFFKLYNFSTKPIISSFSVSQLPLVPGQPVHWVKTVNLNSVSSSEHLLTLPKGASQIKISTTVSKQLSPKVNQKLNPQELSKLALQNSQSKASQTLAKQIRKEKATGFLASLSRTFSKVNSLFATVGDITLEEQVQNITENTLVDLAPIVEETTGVEITPEPAFAEDSSGEATENTPTTTEENIATTTEEVVPDEIIEEATTTDSTSSPQATSTDSTPSIDSGQADSPQAASPTDLVVVEYDTPAPVIAEAETETGKIVSISSTSTEQEVITNVLAFTTIPEIFKVGQEDKIKIKWTNNGDQNVTFHAYDTNNNGKLDYVEWTVPHLSTQTFEIIFISKAFELDANREIINDVYDQTVAQDNVWVTIPATHYIRATFERNLTAGKDMTIYAKGQGTITVFNENGTESIGEFAIDGENTYKIYPDYGDSAVYDLLFTGNIEVDYIVDPDPACPGGMSGDGLSAETACQVTSWTQLDTIRGDYLTNVYYKLMNDLSSSTTGYTGLGDDWTPITDFYGIFDGDNHTISDLVVQDHSYGYAGLFGLLGGSVSNLNLNVLNVTGTNAGGLAGEMGYGTATTNVHVSVSGTISGSGYAGGLTGSTQGGSSLTDCSVTISGTISGGTDAGGFGGFLYSGDAVADCSVTITGTGEVSSTNGPVGGLVGDLASVTISDSYVNSSGTISSVNGYTGGLVGNSTGGTISDSYAIANVSGGNASVGGLVGYNEGVLTNCYHTGTVSSTNAGGVVGYLGGGTITNCYHGAGAVTGSDSGGFIGFCWGGTVSNGSWLTTTATYAIGFDGAYSVPAVSLTSILTASVNAAGTGYSYGDLLTVVQSGASSGVVKVTEVGESGEVISIAVTDIGYYSGTGYTTANDLDTTGGGGSGCTVDITALAWGTDETTASDFYPNTHPVYDYGETGGWAHPPWHWWTTDYPKFTEEPAPSNIAPILNDGSSDDVLPALSQATDGSGKVTITFRVKDLETNNVSAVDGSFYYQVDGGSWVSIADADITGTKTGLSSAVDYTGTLHTLTWDNSKEYIDNAVSANVKVKFKVNDGTVDSNDGVSPAGFSVDNIVPTGSITLAGGATYSTTTSPAITLTTDDASEYQLCLNSATSTNNCTSVARAWASYIASPTAYDFGSDGAKTLYVQFKDTAGNISATYSDGVTVDTVAPTVTAITSVAGDTSAPYYDLTDNSSTAVVYTASADAATCKWNTTDIAYDSMSSTCASTSSCTLNLSDEGSKTVYMRCQDNAGNKATSSSELNYTIDATLPIKTVVSIAGDSSDPYTGSDSTPTLIFTTNETADCFASTDGDETYDQMSDDTDCTVGTDTSHTCTLPDLETDGVKTIYLACKDNAGNKDTASTNKEISYSYFALPNIPSSLTLTVDSTTQITSSWSANSNPAGTEYYIENTTNSTNSGWIQDLTWVSSGLTCNTSYTFEVKAKNGNNVETDTVTAEVTTSRCSSGGGRRNDSQAIASTTPISISISPATSTILTEEKLQLVATITGTTTNNGVIWTILPIETVINNFYGQITDNGLYTAPSHAVNVTIKAIAEADNTKSTTTEIIVRLKTATTTVNTTSPTAPLIPSINSPTTTTSYIFTRTLALGDNGEDVRQLQIFLNTHNFIINATGAGSPNNETTYFGVLTKKALIKFQEANAFYILEPIGLTRGTGIFGQRTIDYVNKLNKR